MHMRPSQARRWLREGRVPHVAVHAAISGDVQHGELAPHECDVGLVPGAGGVHRLLLWRVAGGRGLGEELALPQ